MNYLKTEDGEDGDDGSTADTHPDAGNLHLNLKTKHAKLNSKLTCTHEAEKKIHE